MVHRVRLADSARRGLTLIEVLLAVALLSLTVATTTPIVRDAVRSMQAPTPGDGTWIRAVADEFLSQPELPADRLIDSPSGVVQVDELLPADRAGHVRWFVFSCGDLVVMRRITSQP